MKTSVLALLFLLSVSTFVPAEDSIGDHIRHIVDKTRDKVADIADTAQTRSRRWYHETKENLQLSRIDYTESADRTLSRFSAEIAVLKESAAGPAQRDYFRTRILALEQQAAFAKTQLDNLRLSETEDMFRARQTTFDQTLGSLEAALGQAQEEVGL